MTMFKKHSPIPNFTHVWTCAVQRIAPPCDVRLRTSHGGQLLDRQQVRKKVSLVTFVKTAGLKADLGRRGEQCSEAK